MVENNALKTGIYLRVSTEEQAKEGFSIHAQKEKLTKYAQINDWKIIDFYIDNGISGKNITDRPSVSNLIEDIKNGKVNNVLIYKLDRLTRSVKDLINLIELFEQYNCSFNSVTEKLDTSNAVGRMFIKIIGIFAEFERENLAERVSFGYEQKTREGNYTNCNGVNGYDYIVGKGNLIVNKMEKEIVNRIYNLYLEGTSMLKIARLFNMEKVPTKRGGSWSQATVKSILTNPLYIGKIRYGVGKKNFSKSFKVDGIQEPIIDEYTFEKVQNIIKKRKHLNIKKSSSQSAYFCLVLKCFNCGARFHAKQQIHNNKLYITYYCNNKQTSKCSGISHTKILKVFENYIKDIKIDCNIKSNTNNDKKFNKLIKDLQIKDSVIDYRKFKYILSDMRLNWDYLDTSQRNSFVRMFIDSIIIDINNGNPIIKELNFS